MSYDQSTPLRLIEDAKCHFVHVLDLFCGRSTGDGAALMSNNGAGADVDDAAVDLMPRIPLTSSW